MMKNGLKYFIFINLFNSIIGTQCFPLDNIKYEFFVGNNKPIVRIGTLYGEELGLLNEGENGGSGNSPTDYSYNVLNNMQLGVYVLRSVHLNNFTVNYGFYTNFGIYTRKKWW